MLHYEMAALSHFQFVLIIMQVHVLLRAAVALLIGIVYSFAYNDELACTVLADYMSKHHTTVLRALINFTQNPIFPADDIVNSFGRQNVDYKIVFFCKLNKFPKCRDDFCRIQYGCVVSTCLTGF